MNPREIERELLFHKKLINLLKDHNKSILNESFPEKILSKSTLKLDEEIFLSSLSSEKKVKDKGKLAAKIKKGKKISVFNIQSLSKMPIFIYLVTIFMIPFAFYIGTYYYWIMTNNNISTLLNVNGLVFNNLYTHCLSSLVYANLLMREKIINDTEYECFNGFYQNHTNRMNYFYTNTLARIKSVQLYLEDLPLYGLTAESMAP